MEKSDHTETRTSTYDVIRWFIKRGQTPQLEKVPKHGRKHANNPV